MTITTTEPCPLCESCDGLLRELNAAAAAIDSVLWVDHEGHLRLERLDGEIERLRAQVADLQGANTAEVERRRAADERARVAEAAIVATATWIASRRTP